MECREESSCAASMLDIVSQRRARERDQMGFDTHLVVCDCLFVLVSLSELEKFDSCHCGSTPVVRWKECFSYLAGREIRLAGR